VGGAWGAGAASGAGEGGGGRGAREARARACGGVWSGRDASIGEAGGASAAWGGRRAGQDRFGTIYRIYYKDSFGALIVFDLTDKSTFQSVERWKSQVDSKVKLPGGEPLPVILVANKCDLKDRAIDTAILDDYCREHGFAGWIETSAKDNINVDEAFQMLVREILKHPDAFEAQKAAKAARAKDAAAVDLTDAPAAASGGCC
jgi:Ras family